MTTRPTHPTEQAARPLTGATREQTVSDGALTTPAPASLRAGLRGWWERAWPIIRGPYPTLISRAVLGGVFLFSGVAKALDPTGFATDIKAYQMLPAGPVISTMAYGLPLLEILLGVYLLAGLYLRWSAVVTGALLVIFMIAMGQALARGLQLQCGCFGAAAGASLRDEVSIWSILRDGAWLLMAAHVFFIPSIWTVDSRMQRARRAQPAPAPAASAPATSSSTARPRPTSASAAARRPSSRGDGAKRRR